MYIQLNTLVVSMSIYLCSYPPSVTRCVSFTSAESPVGSSGYGVLGRDLRNSRCCSWAYLS